MGYQQPPGYPPHGYPPQSGYGPPPHGYSPQGYGQPPSPSPKKAGGRTGLLIVLIAIVVLVLAGGGAAFVFLVLVKPTPESTFNEMRSAACAGDVSGFFAHIDKTQVGRGLSDMAIDEARSKGGSLGAKLAEGMVDRAIQAAITEWEDDIKKREDGNLCKMQFVSADKNVQHSGWVRWRTPSGVNKTWKFERYGDKWLVTAMR